jgi:hypothetical protein
MAENAGIQKIATSPILSCLVMTTSSTHPHSCRRTKLYIYRLCRHPVLRNQPTNYYARYLSPHKDGIWDGSPGFDSRQGKETFLYSTASTQPTQPTQPPIPWVLGALSSGVKRPGSQTHYSPPYSAEVELYLHSFIRLHSVVKVVPVLN